jgi:hypothetical protein
MWSAPNPNLIVGQAGDTQVNTDPQPAAARLKVGVSLQLITAYNQVVEYGRSGRTHEEEHDHDYLPIASPRAMASTLL